MYVCADRGRDSQRRRTALLSVVVPDLYANVCMCVRVCECVRAPHGVVLRGEMIVALTHQLLFHGCLVKKLVDLITGDGGWEGTRPRVAV